MVRLAHFVVFSLFLYLVCAGSAFATTYYIAANGSDSNSGTSKSNPWAHAPGMTVCTAACLSTTPRPGDQFIFRGCDSWTMSSQWSWSWSGTSGNNIVLGVDQTWYNTTNCPTAWNRPIFDGSGAFPGTSTKAFLALNAGASFIDVSNFEFKGFFWSGTAAVNGFISYIDLGSGNNRLIHDNYFHGWSHAAGVAENNDANALICGGTSFDLSTKVFLNVIDGSDTARDSFGGIYGYACGEVYQNYFAYLDNGFNGGITSFHDNVLSRTSIPPYSGAGSHNNAIESNTDAPNGAVFYNNIFIHSSTPTGSGVGSWMAPRSGTTSYWFNNISVDGMGSANNNICAYSLTNPGGMCVQFNNTVECGPDSNPNQACLRLDGQTGNGFPGGVELSNNHYISSQGNSPPITVDGGTITQSPNPQLTQTLSQANGQGYSLNQTFVFSPSVSSNATVGAGVNGTGLCALISRINSGAGMACLSDTTYAVSYNASNHAVSWPARTPVVRPSSGAWDVGAYQFGSATVSKPDPPLGLTAVVK